MKRIRLSSPWMTDLEVRAVSDVLLGQVLNMGQETLKFENDLKNFFEREDAFVSCTSSGTSAIQLALQAYGIKQGDEVLVPTYTFVATYQAISATGATPIPCDVDCDDVFISIEDSAKRLTGKTRAIVPVLFAGMDRKISKLHDFAKSNSLVVVEDAAHSFGDENIASRGATMCFSFDSIKNLSCSDGGAVFSTDRLMIDRLNDLRLLGVLGDTEVRFSGKRSWDFDVVEQGWRYHMNNVMAAIGRAQLSRFHEIKQKRQKYSRMYAESLSGLDQIKLYPINTETAVPHIFPIYVLDGKRDDLKAFLLEKGIETGVQYKPNHLLSAFNRGYDLPNAMSVYSGILSIPVHPMLLDEDVSYIIDSIHEFFAK